MEKRRISQISERYNAIVHALVGSPAGDNVDYRVTPVDYLTLGFPILVTCINNIYIQPIYHTWNNLRSPVEEIIFGLLIMPFVILTDILFRATALLIKLPISLVLAVPLTILLTIGQTIRVIFDTIHPSSPALNNLERNNHIDEYPGYFI